MAGAKERRIAPRKTCVVPLRFRVLSGVVGVGVASALPGSMASPGATPKWPSLGRMGIQDGQTENISERGIYFTSSMKLSVGEPLEMYFTMPSELTGRSAESVKCDARVVHVSPVGGISGVHPNDRPPHKASLRVPSHMIPYLESRVHALNRRKRAAASACRFDAYRG